jgi:hypothetical protein
MHFVDPDQEKREELKKLEESKRVIERRIKRLREYLNWSDETKEVDGE